MTNDKPKTRRIQLNHRFDLVTAAPGWERQVGTWLVVRGGKDWAWQDALGVFDFHTVDIDDEWSYRVDLFQPARLETRLNGEAAEVLGVDPDDLIANLRIVTGCGGRIRSADEWDQYINRQWALQQAS